jgi:type VI secretion system protein ImpA
MPTARLLSDDLLDPISPESPAGSDLRWTPEWDRIKEARRADDSLQAGKWAKKEQKTADWRLADELIVRLLRESTKDLQLTMWLMESRLQLYGFAGLRDGLWLSREMMIRYWDQGLHPAMEDGPEDRSGPFRWLDERLVESILAIPITARRNGEPEFSVLHLRDARRVGSEANCRDENGDLDSKKKREYDVAVAAGRPSTEIFARAVRETSRAAYEDLYADFEAASSEYKALEKAIDDKFGNAAPSLASCRSTFHEIEQELTKNLEQKRREEPTRPGPDVSPEDGPKTSPISTFLPGLGLPSESSTSGEHWLAAEQLTRSGQIDRGLAEMTRLAAFETTGRCRFQRKLLLAEICLNSQRQRLARVILEELAGQIDKYQLEAWEASDVIARVWTRLYEIYKHGESPDHDRASQLYERLCRLDPWQALACSQ